MILVYKINLLHVVSRTLQGRHREPSVKIIRSPLSAEFWRHCVLSGITQLEWGTHNQSVLQSHFVPLRHGWPHFSPPNFIQISNYVLNGGTKRQLCFVTRYTLD